MGTTGREIIKATAIPESPRNSRPPGGNFLVRHWRGTLMAIGGLAAGVTGTVLFLGAGSHEVPTGITSNLPSCEKNSKTVEHISYEQPKARVDILIGNSDDKKVTVTIRAGADVTMEPSKGMLDITSPDSTVPGSPQDHKLRTYQAGSEVRTIEAIAAPHNQTELIVSKVCS